MRNAGLEEAQAGVKIARRNINNLKYPNDTTLMAESKDSKITADGDCSHEIKRCLLLERKEKYCITDLFLKRICISEVIDISPGNLDSSLCFLQPSVSHDVLCIEVK